MNKHIAEPSLIYGIAPALLGASYLIDRAAARSIAALTPGLLLAAAAFVREILSVQ